MASSSKSAQAADSVVAERRLRPIYDSIDSGNNKKALQEADRVLKKDPNSLCAKSLKALALVRLSRLEEAWTLIEDVERHQPAEEHTLQALTYCFKDLVRPERIALLYEGACSRCPQNEEYLSHLFMAYVRIRDYKKQLQVAQELYKQTKKPAYHFWSVMSTIMQGATDPSRAYSLYYPLAEGMIRRVINDSNFQADGGSQLYLLILQDQKKYKEALNLLQSDLGEKYFRCMWNKEYVILDLMKKLEQWDKVFDICCRTLSASSSDWELYLGLFDSALSIVQGSTDNVPKKTELIQKATDVILDLIESERDKVETVATRGPYLARLHWILSLLEKDCVIRAELGTYRLGEPLNLLTEYFRLFAHKPSCFSDIKPYLCLLGEQQRDEFLESISDIVGLSHKECRDSTISFAQTAKDAQRHACCIQLSRCLGAHSSLSSGEKFFLASRWLLRYEDGLCGEKINSSEIPCCDQYLLLTLHLLWDIYVEQGDSGLLSEMVLLAKIGLRNNSSNFHFKFIVVKIYALLGAGTCVLNCLKEMDLKHIQKDTLGYLVFDQLSPFGLFKDLSDWLMFELEYFFAQSEKETMESLVTSYRIGSFVNIWEIITFNEKLQLSFQRISSQIVRKYFLVITWCNSVDSLVDTLKLTSCTNPYSESIHWTSLRDNRDFQCHPCWDPVNKEDDRTEERKKSFQEVIDLVRFRQFVLRILALLCEDKIMANDMSTGDKKISLNHLKTLLSQLKAHYSHSKASHCETAAWSLQGPLPTHFGVYLQGGYFEILFCFLECACCIIWRKQSELGEGGKYEEEEKECSINYEPSLERSTSLPPDDELRSYSLPSADELQALFRRMFSSHLLGTGTPGSGGSQARFPHMQLCHISYLIQTLGLCLMIAMICWSQLQVFLPEKQNIGKKSKKKQRQHKNSDVPAANGTSAYEHPLVTQFRDVVDVLCEAPQSIGRLVDDLNLILETAEFNSLAISEKQGLKCGNEQDRQCIRRETWKQMKESYEKSLKEMDKVIGHQISVASNLIKTMKY